MAEFWQDTQQRAMQTIAVWNTFHPDFRVRGLGMGQHEDNLQALVVAASERNAVQDDVDVALATRDADSRELTSLCLRLPRFFDSQMADDDDYEGELDDIYAIDPNDEAALMVRADLITSLWEHLNARAAAQTPPAPPFIFGTLTVEQWQDRQNAHRSLQSALENKRGTLSSARTVLRKADRVVDKANKNWYRAWSGIYPPGTPENDALSQIDTGDATQAPDALPIAGATAQPDHTIALTFGPVPDNASQLQVLHQVVGTDADFAHAVAATPPAQTLGPFSAGAVVNLVTRASNSAGTMQSGVVSVTVV